MLAVLAALLPATAAVANGAADKCAALDYLYAQARTEFPKLADKRLDVGRCALVKQEFTCAWVFPTYGFAAAEDQADKLTQCTAAETGVRKVESERGATRFQLNPETIVAIGKPQSADGNWKLTLRIVSSADWN